jgi:hypothetical protein
VSEKIIERPYKVYTGVQTWEYQYPQGSARSDVEWTYDKSFETEADAEAYANRTAEDYEFVKIEKRENN